jgi:hypothetical protein
MGIIIFNPLIGAGLFSNRNLRSTAEPGNEDCIWNWLGPLMPVVAESATASKAGGMRMDPGRGPGHLAAGGR